MERYPLRPERSNKIIEGIKILNEAKIIYRDSAASLSESRNCKLILYVDPEPNTYTLLLCGPKVRNWGFYVKGKWIRPLKFFSKYGHEACRE